MTVVALVSRNLKQRKRDSYQAYIFFDGKYTSYQVASFERPQLLNREEMFADIEKRYVSETDMIIVLDSTEKETFKLLLGRI